MKRVACCFTIWCITPSRPRPSSPTVSGDCRLPASNLTICPHGKRQATMASDRPSRSSSRCKACGRAKSEPNETLHSQTSPHSSSISDSSSASKNGFATYGTNGARRRFMKRWNYLGRRRVEETTPNKISKITCGLDNGRIDRFVASSHRKYPFAVDENCLDVAIDESIVVHLLCIVGPTSKIT